MFSRKETEPRDDRASEGLSVGGAARDNGRLALIGSSIRIEGVVGGQEDLLIQGEVSGKVLLLSNRVTIGSNGRVFADVYAASICIEGQVDGHLVAHDEILVKQSARISGSITAPRISLDDGAQFNGTIDMDPAAPKLAEVFGSGETVDNSTNGQKANKRG